MKYRVWMYGKSMSATYDGYVDVYANDADEAVYKAKQKLTGRNGSFFDWSPSMFHVVKIETIM